MAIDNINCFLQEEIIEENDNSLREWQDKANHQDQQLVQQALRIEELELAFKKSTLRDSSIINSTSSSSSTVNPSSTRRPKSVPAHLHSKNDLVGFFSVLKSLGFFE